MAEHMEAWLLGTAAIEVARANGSDHDAGCTNGATNDVSSLFADDASPGLFASVAVALAPSVNCLNLSPKGGH